MRGFASFSKKHFSPYDVHGVRKVWRQLLSSVDSIFPELSPMYLILRL